jgi:hypothetical protein
MRLVKVSTTEQHTDAIISIAFETGIKTASVHKVEARSADGGRKSKDIVDLQTSTPQAKRFIVRLLGAGFYNPVDISVVTRQPRSIISDDDIKEITSPLEEPGPDLYEELWQFSHVTYGLVGRVLISGGLLSYGLINQHILLIIAGLLFLPVLPMLIAISFGVVGREWKLALQGAGALVTSIILLFVSGVVIAMSSDPPMRYQEFSSLPVSFAISVAVGIAAGLASMDDAGRRELIGLAAASQIGIVPTWLGVTLIFGLPPAIDGSDVLQIVTMLVSSVLIIVTVVAIVQLASGVTRNIDRINKARE